MTTNEQIRAWKKAHTRQYFFYVNRDKDGAVADWLDGIVNRQQYLVNLVKEDMNAKAEESK